MDLQTSISCSLSRGRAATACFVLANNNCLKEREGGDGKGERKEERERREEDER